MTWTLAALIIGIALGATGQRRHDRCVTERATWNETTARAFADAGDRLVDENDALKARLARRRVPGGAA